MKAYRTRNPGERLNARYVPKKKAYRIAARGRALYIDRAPLAGALAAIVTLLVVVILLTSATTQAPPADPVAQQLPEAEEVAPIATEEEIETTEPTAPPSRYAGIELSEEDVETLARLVWLEARGEPFEGQVAVVEIVLNRILSPSFPGTVEEVVYQTGPIQFSPAALIPETTAGEEQYRAVEVALAAAEPITDADVVYFSTSAQNDRVFTTIGGHVFCRE